MNGVIVNGCKKERNKNALNAPCSVYEIHLGSWKRDPSDNEEERTNRYINCTGK